MADTRQGRARGGVAAVRRPSGPEDVPVVGEVPQTRRQKISKAVMITVWMVFLGAPLRDLLVRQATRRPPSPGPHSGWPRSSPRTSCSSSATPATHAEPNGPGRTDPALSARRPPLPHRGRRMAGVVRRHSLEVMTDDTLARLMTFRNVLVTSHQAYFTRDAVGQIIDTTVRNVADYLAGRTSDNVLVRPKE